MLRALKFLTVNIEIPRALVQNFKRQARAAFPKETLAYLLGVDAGTNVAVCELWTPDDVAGACHEAYVELRPHWGVLAAEYAKEHDLTVLGTVHSHPYKGKGTDPTLSEGDMGVTDLLGPLVGICVIVQMPTGRFRTTFRIWGPSIPTKLKLT